MSRSGPREDGLAIRGTIQDVQYQAYMDHQAGMSWEEVAKKHGYDSGRVIQVEVRAYIQRAAVGMDMAKREEVLDLEMSRLDKMQYALWDRATVLGDTKAVDSILRIMSHRAKLLGLDMVAANQGPTTYNTVVVSGDKDEYIRSLRLVNGTGDDDTA